ncbi:MAG TPA: ammonia channel protein, partial [bacterium]|nr:ammonia channel protein [bacterium]
IASGHFTQVLIQLKTAGATALYSVVVTVILYFIVSKTVGFRVDAKSEELGLDLSQHGEEGYSQNLG